MGSTWLSGSCQRLFSKHCISLLNPRFKIPSQRPKAPAHRALQSHRLDFNFFKKERSDPMKNPKHPQITNPATCFPTHFFFKISQKKGRPPNRLGTDFKSVSEYTKQKSPDHRKSIVRAL
jgi:hypothetical protein